MSTFANVYVGAAANDGTGDPLRTAFIKIDQNFANIAAVGGSGVTSVAGRSGNVVLAVNDVTGAASTYYVANYVAAGNAYVDSRIAALGNISVVALTNHLNTLDANVGVISGEITTLFSNIASQNSTLSTVVSNIASQNNSLSILFSNIASQNNSLSILNSELTAVNVAIINANINMKSYVDNITRISNVSIVDQTMSGLNDGHPLVINFPGTQFTSAATVEGLLTANATSTVTNTNTGSIQVPNGGIGVAGNIYLGTLPGSRLQVGTGGQLLPNVLAQFTSNVNNYAQINMQNLSNSPFSSSDFVATANNGNDTQNFIDLGIAGSNYNFPGYGAYKPNDGYLLVDGGNLLLNTDTVGKSIRFIVGGLNDANQVGQFTSTGLAVTGNIVTTANITAANIELTGNTGFPTNTSTIVSWARVTVGSTAYWTPLYQ